MDWGLKNSGIGGNLFVEYSYGLLLKNPTCWKHSWIKLWGGLNSLWAKEKTSLIIYSYDPTRNQMKFNWSWDYFLKLMDLSFNLAMIRLFFRSFAVTDRSQKTVRTGIKANSNYLRTKIKLAQTDTKIHRLNSYLQRSILKSDTLKKLNKRSSYGF